MTYLVALSSLKSASILLAMSLANVVLPLPGGPQNIMLPRDEEVSWLILLPEVLAFVSEDAP